MKTIKGLRWWIMALVCLSTITNHLARNALGAVSRGPGPLPLPNATG
ncbi:hypothetical protein B7R78_0011315 [Ralstonia solanacearum]|nr:hypothetical protein [Ralstonia solanacearum]MBT1537698.1 hypothetical protein [Ralstonia solanacearum]QOK82688.1 hypothetical protein HF906_11300 [Ralstonia solanacearum]CCF96564.1 exported hypothetical protein [Ralstonia solanacearum K60]